MTSVVTPLPFLVQQHLPFGVLAAFDGKSFGLVFRVGGVLVLVGVGATAIEVENPLRDVAVVYDGDGRTRVAVEVLFDPLHAFGVQVDGRLVEEQ